MDTREWLSDFVSNQPSDKVALLVGLVLERVFRWQTDAEKAANVTKDHNNVGFTAFDAKSGCRDAKTFLTTGRLAQWQVKRWTKPERGRPRICKYHTQVDIEDLQSALSSSVVPPVAEDVEKLRAEYKRIRGLFVSGSSLEPKQFDALVREAAGDNPTPERWVNVARGMKVKCGRCAGTGKFITMVVNNKPTGPGGICFRCEGKGYQTEADARRNWGYDRYGIKL